MNISAATVRGTNYEIEANRDDAGIPPAKKIKYQLTAAPSTGGEAGNPLTEAPQATGAPPSGPTTGVAGGPAGGPNAPQATDAPTSGPTTGVAGGPTGGPNASPSGLFPQGIPNVGLSAGAGSLDFLPNNQRFQALKSLVEDFFQSLEPMFEELWNQNPQMMFSIQDHKSEYLRLIKVLVERGEGGNLLSLLTPTMPPTVSVTPEEGGAIVPETPEDGEAIVSSGYGELQRGYSSQSLLKQEG